MNFKVGFLHGAWRTVEADLYTLDDNLLVFSKDGQPILTCVLGNVLFFAPFTPEPEKTSHDVDRGDLFSKARLS